MRKTQRGKRERNTKGDNMGKHTQGTPQGKERATHIGEHMGETYRGKRERKRNRG